MSRKTSKPTSAQNFDSFWAKFHSDRSAAVELPKNSTSASDYAKLKSEMTGQPVSIEAARQELHRGQARGELQSDLFRVRCPDGKIRDQRIWWPK